mmetsp:Transcript_135265/g.246644  ORF Transcript_135265/g.246644 Transcript_135265/m.246644 type:complete len:802 (-) Transcript_135265:109-2514(-)
MTVTPSENEHSATNTVVLFSGGDAMKSHAGAGGPCTLNFHRQGRQPRAGSRSSRSPCVAARSRARGRSRDVCLGSSPLNNACVYSAIDTLNVQSNMVNVEKEEKDSCDDQSASTNDMNFIMKPGEESEEEDNDMEVGLEFITSLLDDAVDDYTDEAVHEVVFAGEAPVVYSVPEPPIAEEEVEDIDAQEVESEQDEFVDAQEVHSDQDLLDAQDVKEVEREEDEEDELETMFSVFGATALELTKASIDEATESFCLSMVNAAEGADVDEDDEDAVTVLSSDGYSEEEQDQVAVVAEQMAREFVWEPPPELTPEVPEKAHSTAMETILPAANTLSTCTRCSFSRRLRPAAPDAPVPEEPFPMDCLPPSQTVAPALAPRAEAFQLLMGASTTTASFTSTATRSTVFTTEAREKLCRALATATLQQLWLRAPWQQQVAAKVAAAEAKMELEATPPPPTPVTVPAPPTAPPPSARSAAPRRRMMTTPITTQMPSEQPALEPAPPSSPPSRPQTAQPSMPPSSPTGRPRTAQHGGRPRRSFGAAVENKACPPPTPAPPAGRPSRPGSRPTGMIVAPTAPPPASVDSAPQPAAPVATPPEAPSAPAARTAASPSPASPKKPPAGARRPVRPGSGITSDASNKGASTFRLDMTDLAAAAASTAGPRSSSLTNSYQTLGSEFYVLSEDDAGSGKEFAAAAKSPRPVLKSPRTTKALTPRTAHMSPRTSERQASQGPTALELDLGISAPEAKPVTPRDALASISSPRISKAAGTGLLPKLPAAANSADSISWSMGVGRVGSTKIGRKSFY